VKAFLDTHAALALYFGTTEEFEASADLLERAVLRCSPVVPSYRGGMAGATDTSSQAPSPSPPSTAQITGASTTAAAAAGSGPDDPRPSSQARAAATSIRAASTRRERVTPRVGSKNRSTPDPARIRPGSGPDPAGSGGLGPHGPDTRVMVVTIR